MPGTQALGKPGTRNSGGICTAQQSSLAVQFKRLQGASPDAAVQIVPDGTNVEPEKPRSRSENSDREGRGGPAHR